MSLCEFESADPNYSNTLKRYQNKAHTTCESFRKHCCKFLPYLYCYGFHNSCTEYNETEHPEMVPKLHSDPLQRTTQVRIKDF